MFGIIMHALVKKYNTFFHGGSVTNGERGERESCVENESGEYDITNVK